MSLHLGHYLGLSFIKKALENSGTQYANTPLSEGSDKNLQRIREAFNSLPGQNEMTPEDRGKTGAEAAFDARGAVMENRPDKDRQWERGAPDQNANAQSIEKVWREHDSFSPQHDDGVVVDSIPEPGPVP